MKTVLKISMLFVATILMFISCEKEDPLQPDENALKLITVADNSDMSYPYNSYVYDENDLLVQILNEYGNIRYAIEYDEDNILLSATLYSTNGDVDKEKSITWNENGFMISWVDIHGVGETVTETYELDSEGRITNYNGESVVWNSDESLTLNGEYVLTFDKTYHHPLSAINLAVLTATEERTQFPDCYLLDNTYLPLEVDWSGGDFEEYEYDFNEKGFPTRLTWITGDEDSQYIEQYYHFEYESD